MQKFIIKKEESGQSLEKYVKKVLKEAPLSFIYKLFRKKDVKVNGHWQDLKFIIHENDEVSIYITDAQLEEFRKKYTSNNIEVISNWIIYEDNNVLLVNKPRGELVQKGVESDNALDSKVIDYLINKNEYDPKKDVGYIPAPVHRLDRNTSGIVIFGKNLETLQYFSKIMSNKDKVCKKYMALVKGHVQKEGTIDSPLFKSQNGFVTVDFEKGKDAITKYKLIKYIGDYSLVDVTLLTGRTHQIRVHFASIGHPLIGDNKYGDFALNKEIENKFKFKNQFLCSYYLEFLNVQEPIKNLNKQIFEIELDKEYIDLINLLDNNK